MGNSSWQFEHCVFWDYSTSLTNNINSEIGSLMESHLCLKLTTSQETIATEGPLSVIPKIVTHGWTLEQHSYWPHMYTCSVVLDQNTLEGKLSINALLKRIYQHTTPAPTFFVEKSRVVFDSHCIDVRGESEDGVSWHYIQYLRNGIFCWKDEFPLRNWQATVQGELLWAHLIRDRFIQRSAQYQIWCPPRSVMHSF